MKVNGDQMFPNIASRPLFFLIHFQMHPSTSITSFFGPELFFFGLLFCFLNVNKRDHTYIIFVGCVLRVEQRTISANTERRYRPTRMDAMLKLLFRWSAQMCRGDNDDLRWEKRDGRELQMVRRIVLLIMAIKQ